MYNIVSTDNEILLSEESYIIDYIVNGIHVYYLTLDSHDNVELVVYNTLTKTNEKSIYIGKDIVGDLDFFDQDRLIFNSTSGIFDIDIREEGKVTLLDSCSYTIYEPFGLIFDNEYLSIECGRFIVHRRFDELSIIEGEVTQLYDNSEDVYVVDVKISPDFVYLLVRGDYDEIIKYDRSNRSYEKIAVEKSINGYIPVSIIIRGD